MNTNRPLPRSLDPLPGESLPGFVLRLAHRLDRPPARLGILTGLATGHPGNALGFPVHLDLAATQAFATVTRLSTDEVAELCLSNLASRYPPLDPAFLGRRRRPEMLASTEPWVFGRFTRYCPQCLAGDGSQIQTRHGGAWQRLWRLPPVFACTIHRRLLDDRCPSCRQPAHSLHASSDRIVPCPRLEGMHPAQCRNRVPGARNRRPPACGAALDTPEHPVSGVDSSTLQDLLRLQQRLLLLLHHDGPAGAATFGEPAPAGRYFTDLRLIASLICVTWPAARPLSLAALAEPLDDHVAQQRQLIEHARQTKAKILRHAIYDKPPAGSVACAGLLFVADQILTTDQDHNGDRLGELIAGPLVKNWAAHFIRAENHCSEGLQTAAAPHIAPYRTGQRQRRQQTGSLAAERLGVSNPRRLPAPHRRRAKRKPQPQTLSLPLLAGPARFGHEHIPAFLTDDWHHRHLASVTGIKPRLLRRAAAVALVQLAENCDITQAAALLQLPAGAARNACRKLRARIRHADDGPAILASIRALAGDLDSRTDLVDYGQRRTALATWRINLGDWRTIVSGLRSRENRLQREHTNWDERKRMTASALIWIRVTQGEHLFTPHRYSPGAPPGSPDDQGLAIDRAWWRSRTGKRGHHYAELKRACDDLADRLADQIDHATTVDP